MKKKQSLNYFKQQHGTSYAFRMCFLFCLKQSYKRKGDIFSITSMQLDAVLFETHFQFCICNMEIRPTIFTYCCHHCTEMLGECRSTGGSDSYEPLDTQIG